ncbi:proline synthase co-transcribed bacterial homolog protein-like protein [Tanacetum coccineum]
MLPSKSSLSVRKIMYMIVWHASFGIIPFGTARKVMYVVVRLAFFGTTPFALTAMWSVFHRVLRADERLGGHVEDVRAIVLSKTRPASYPTSAALTACVIFHRFLRAERDQVDHVEETRPVPLIRQVYEARHRCFGEKLSSRIHRKGSSECEVPDQDVKSTGCNCLLIIAQASK